MSESIIREIQELREMTVAQLRDRWRVLYGEESRSGNRAYLWRRLAWRVQELAYGGLAAEAKERMLALTPAADLRLRMPAGWHPHTAATSTPPGTTRPRRNRRLPAAGSTLVRKYKGEDIRVRVLDDGFEWDGRRFESLSEAAFAVTGSRWNGWLFFGLTKRNRGR